MNPTPTHPQLNNLSPHDHALAWLVGLLLFGLYMLTFDGTIHSTDGLSLLAVTENLVKHGRFDTAQLENWESAALGVDGWPYTFFALGPSLVLAPVYWLALKLPLVGLSQTTLVLIPLLIAGAAPYLYLSSRRLGYAVNTAIIAALLSGVATLAWPYTYDLYAEPFTYFSFAVAFYFALAYRQDGHLWQVFVMSLALGLTILHKVVNAGIVLPFFWYVAVPDFRLFKFRAYDWRAIGVAAPAVGLSVLAFLAYNIDRFGDPLDAGYRFNYFFQIPLWVGVVGMLFNPFKSILLYVPLFLLIPFSINQMGRRHPRELALIGGLLLGYFIIFGAIFLDWGGGRSWGPRYLVPLNGLLTLLLLPLIDRALQPGRWGVRIALIAFGALSTFIQILGLSARDYPFLGADDYWVRPPNFAIWGTFPADDLDHWPIWGHLLRFDPAQFDTIWHWRWQDLNQFDAVSLLALLLIGGLGLGGLLAILHRHPRRASWWVAAAWLVAFGGVGLVLLRHPDDPRSIKMADEADDLWPAYRELTRQLPAMAGPNDTVIFTDRRFEFYLFDHDKSMSQRFVVAKPTQPDILAAVPAKVLERASLGKVWLVTDDLDNRTLAYSTELWLAERGQAGEPHLFGDSVRLTPFDLNPKAEYTPLPSEPALVVVVDPNQVKFNGIAALLGWQWLPLETAQPPLLAAGETHPFELYWIYRGKAPDDKFFVRLVDPAGQVALEQFTTPRPSSHLILGQLIIEDAALNLPADLPPGPYRLQIGFTIPVVEAGELLFDLPSNLTEVQVVNLQTHRVSDDD